MDDRQKHILELEQDASQIVEQLSALKREVSSYRTATDELDKARKALASFLEETQNLTQQTHKLITTVNEIGSAKIFTQLERIQLTLAENAKKRAKDNLFLGIGLGVLVVLQIVALILLRTTG